jgi:hypothetical protein
MGSDGHSLLNPVDRTWQAFRDAVLAHPGISGAKFDHATKRAELMTEKTVVPSRRRLSATLVVDADGTRVVISGAGPRGRTHQVATELLADLSRRLGAPVPEPASEAAPPWGPPVVQAAPPEPPIRTPRTPPAPPPPLVAAAPVSATLPSLPTRRTPPSDDALSELAGG